MTDTRTISKDDLFAAEHMLDNIGKACRMTAEDFPKRALDKAPVDPEFYRIAKYHGERLKQRLAYTTFVWSSIAPLLVRVKSAS